MIETHQIIEFLRTAVAGVFSTMLGLEIEAGPARSESVAPTIGDGVLSVVGLAGPYSGAGWFLCSSSFAREMCARLLTTEVNSVDEEVLDAVGEITNMIVGNFKTMVEERVGPLGLSIPTVIYGRNFTSRSIGQGDWIVLPIQCGNERMEIRVCLTPAREPAAARAGFSHPGVLLA
ncbi:MAG: chemotaxis protein CheX [Bryobacteraceae bacterium]|jgi:chemotaxis protein CheX